MKLLKRFYVLILVCAAVLPAGATTPIPAPAALLPLIHEMRDAGVYGYDYKVKMLYPSGQRAELSGQMLMDTKVKSMLDKNSYGITLVNKEWTYHADLQQQRLQISRIAAALKGKPDMFNAGMLNSFSDSMFLHASTITAYSRENGILKISLRFSKGFRVDEWRMEYDLVRHVPLTMYMRMRHVDMGETTTMELNCSAFRKQLPPDAFSIQPWFEYRNNQIILKQFRNYKLQSVL